MNLKNEKKTLGRLLVETYTDNPHKLKILKKTLREMCPYMELFLVRIFLYSDWIRRFTSCIQSEYRKIRTRITPYLDTFQVVEVYELKGSMQSIQNELEKR